MWWHRLATEIPPVIVVLGGAALIAALCFLYVAAVMFAGGKGFMRRVSREGRYRFHLMESRKN
jgi:hypothetical protein